MKKLMTICAVLVGMILVAPGSANGSFTSINPSPGSEPSLLGSGILDSLYGLANVTRIDDAGDQLWMSVADGTATAKAKYAGANETFGYFPGASGDDFTSLFTVLAGTDGELSGYSGFIPVYPAFRLGLMTPYKGGMLWSSQQSDNATMPTFDHMVTWLITSGTSAGNYVVAWEVDNPAGDADYQDLVVEIQNAAPVIPAPGAILLGSIGVSLVGWLRRRRTL